MCSILTSDAKPRRAARARRLGHVWRWTVCSSASERERVRERGPEHGEAVAAAARRAGQVDDERAPAHTRDAAREQRVRRPSRSRRRGSPRRCPAPRARSRRAVASGVTSRGAEPGPAGRQHEAVALRRRAPDRGRDRVTLVRRRRGARPRSPPRASSSSSTSPLASSRVPALTPSDTVSTAALTAAPSSSRRSRTSAIDHPLVDRLRHVVDRQRGNRRGGQRLHLDAGLRGRLGAAAISTAAVPDLERRPRRARAAADGRAGSARSSASRP